MPEETESINLSELALTNDLMRKEQREITKRVQLEIDKRMNRAKDIASQAYELGAEKKLDMIRENINKARTIAETFRQQVEDYLCVPAEEAVEKDVERIHHFDRYGESSTVRHKNMTGEMRARGKLVEAATKIDATIANTIELLMTTAPFMGKKEPEDEPVNKSPYRDMLKATQSAEVILEGEVVPDGKPEVDEELRKVLE